MKFSNIFSHYKTITRHRHLVMKYCFRVGLYKQGLLHDLSKYSPSEFIPGCKYYQGYRSPNDEERKQIGYSSAWLHHKGRNKHHYEYWTDYPIVRSSGRKLQAVEMPVKYLAEMFCDRVAASKVYKGEKYKDSDPYDYHESIRSHFIMNERSDELLTSMLLVLKEQGEDAAFANVKKLVKESRNTERKQ